MADAALERGGKDNVAVVLSHLAVWEPGQPMM
jgi:hypothetical protein